LSYQELTTYESGGTSALSYNVEFDISGGGSGPWVTNPQGYSSDDPSLEAIISPLTEG
jgi:hypothetical protein